MTEKKITINNVPIKYIFKPRKYDTKHLVVVFSGFGGQSEFTYDFLNVLQNVHAHVLWIKDEFFGHCSYYLAHNNDFSIEASVVQLIQNIMDENFLSKEEVTILGASKGGSAALYYGLKYGFTNIISSVPQLLIGDYVVSNWPKVGDHMLGRIENRDKFNALIKDLLISDNNINRNIYLLTSEVDVQYENHIAPFLKYFYKYNNFNVLFSESILVREHNQITAHHVDIIMGIIALLSANVAPYLGNRILSGDLPIKKTEDPERIIELKKAYVQGDVFFIEGIGIVRGKEAKDYNQINYKLILVSGNKEIELNIAKAHRPYLTKLYYNGNLCIYDKCLFTTYKYAGINISQISTGSYQLYLEVIFSDMTIREPLKYTGGISESAMAKVQSQDGNLYLIVN